MGAKVIQNRIRETYHPVMTARQLEHKRRIEQLPCAKCGGQGGVGHHLLIDCEGKKWRRNHEYLVPLCDPCHTALHRSGEPGGARAIERANGFDVIAIDERDISIGAGIL